MANHCTNYISLDTSEHFEEIRDLLKGEVLGGSLGDSGEEIREQAIDFNQLKQQPPELDDTISPCPLDPELIALCGYINWYDWRLEHWGTKWNAYDIETGQWNADERGLQFSTAWCPPTPLIEELSRRFPTMVLRHEFEIEGEDGTTVREYTNGVMLSETIENNEPDQDYYGPPIVGMTNGTGVVDYPPPYDDTAFFEDTPDIVHPTLNQTKE